MRILVTGREGQVARSLAERNPGLELIFTGRDELDLFDPSSIERTVSRVAPELIISAAAYTAVDRAESEPDLARAINGQAPGVIGMAAARIDAAVIHLSTDYVFDGTLDRPWRESDPVSPLGVYGRSKLEGEVALRRSGARHAIVRTAWVYSPFGRNFVKTMLHLARERAEVSVVSDQHGCPTSSFDIADGIFAIVNAWNHKSAVGADQIYHLAGTGDTTWDDLARQTFAISERYGGVSARVRSIASCEYPTPALRPRNSRLNCERFAQTFGYQVPLWQDSLDKVVQRLVS